jgi:hypothetical protein
MKILYLASNPTEQISLSLEREMTELQRRLMAVDKLGSIVFKPLPYLKIDELTTVISDFCPDVVHISVHGERRGVLFADGQDIEKFVSNEQFVAHFRAVKSKPKLVYLSACEGETLAQLLSEVVPFVLGMTDKVTNEAAIRSAVKFYEWLGSGSTIREAVDISQPLLETIDEGGVSSKLFIGKGQDADIKLVEVFRMMACFSKLEDTRKLKRPPLLTPGKLSDRDGKFEIEVGFVGCPKDTMQLLMFTTDETFINQEAVDEGEEYIESQMTWLVRQFPDGGEIWFEHETIESEGDCKMYGVAVTSNEDCATASSTLTEALQRYYFEEKYHTLTAKQESVVEECVRSLVLNRGPRAKKASKSNSSPSRRSAGGRSAKDSRRK